MRIKHGGLLGSMNEDRRYPARAIPNHMLPHGLGGGGVRSNAVRNRLVKGTCCQTDGQRKHHKNDEGPAPRERRTAHDAYFRHFLHAQKQLREL